MKRWVTPSEAAEAMSKRAGYQISVTDLRQLRRHKRLRFEKRVNRRIVLYDLDEVLAVDPPKKRNPQPIDTLQKL